MRTVRRFFLGLVSTLCVHCANECYFLLDVFFLTRLFFLPSVATRFPRFSYSVVKLYSAVVLAVPFIDPACKTFVATFLCTYFQYSVVMFLIFSLHHRLENTCFLILKISVITLSPVYSAAKKKYTFLISDINIFISVCYGQVCQLI